MSDEETETVYAEGSEPEETESDGNTSDDEDANTGE